MKVVQRAAVGGPATVGATKSAAADGPSDEDVEYWFKIMQEKMTTRFSELRRAFRTLDEDASGALDREEFKQVLVMFNLGIPDRVMNKLIDLADFDGDGSINYAEFARIFTGENVRLRRTGPGLEKMRKAHRTLRNIILTRYGSMTAAFKEIDADGSGAIRRAELRRWLATISKSVPD